MLNVNRLSKPLDEKHYQDAVNHAIEQFPNESAGIIVENRGYIPLMNISKTPAIEAIVRNVENIYSESDKIIAIVHSHTNGFKHASLADMQCQFACDIPFMVLCINDKKQCDYSFSWGGDKIPSMIGRDYVSGVNDCCSIIKDFYMISGIELEDFPRGQDIVESGIDVYVNELMSRDFELVSMDNLQIGDILLAQIKGKVLNHAAIYIGQDKILHHLIHRLNCRDSLPRWSKHFTTCLRYKHEIDFSKSIEALK